MSKTIAPKNAALGGHKRIIIYKTSTLGLGFLQRMESDGDLLAGKLPFLYKL